jgi:hypothetical protein
MGIYMTRHFPLLKMPHSWYGCFDEETVSFFSGGNQNKFLGF